MKIYKPTYQDKTTGETRQTECYYLRYRGRRFPLHVTDKRAAENKARDLMTTLALGYDPAKQEKARTEPIVLLIDAYYDSLQATAGDRQRTLIRQRLTKVFNSVGITTITGFTTEAVQGWMNKVKIARRTKHHYRTAIRSFGTWLAASGRLPRSPVDDLEPIRNIESDRKRVRRALTQEEFDALVAAAESSLRRYCKLTGPQRAMLYQLAAGTGLRRSEVASLLPSSFALVPEGQEGVSTVTVEAAYTKNKTRAVQPLPPSLVPLLREYLRGMPERPLWPVGQRLTGAMVAGDLEEAGIPLVVSGRCFDFHSLRGQYATRLVRAGVGLAVAQKLMRHSTPTLTANVYTHLNLGDLGAAVAGL